MEWSTNSVSLQGRSLVSHRKSAPKGTFHLQSIRSHCTSLLSRHSKLGGQALVLDVEGTWRELTGVVNKLAANLTNQVRNIARVTKAVALGDLSKQIDVDARGEILDLKNTVNGMVVRLRALAAEVTRVTLEVGSQGILGGQAHVPDVEGVWLELTRNVRHFRCALCHFGAFSSYTWHSLATGESDVFQFDGPSSVDCHGHDSGC